jgi:hypothetical protein
MMATAEPSTAAPDIQIPGMAGFLVNWMKEVQMAGVKPSNRVVAELYAQRTKNLRSSRPLCPREKFPTFG